MSHKSRLYDLSKVNNQAVKQLLADVQKECQDRTIDGAIVIIGRNGGKKTTAYRIGSLTNPDSAAMEAFRLELTMAFEKSKQQG